MTGHSGPISFDLVVTDHSEELDALRPRVLEGCAACRACELWRRDPDRFREPEQRMTS